MVVYIRALGCFMYDIVGRPLTLLLDGMASTHLETFGLLEQFKVDPDENAFDQSHVNMYMMYGKSLSRLEVHISQRMRSHMRIS